MYSTRVSRHVAAAPSEVYRALVDAASIAAWRVPDGMTSEVHEFDAQEGGRFWVTLTYGESGAQGKSSAHSDTYHGRFVVLVPDERVVEEFAFESDDEALQATMRMTTTLLATEEGTIVTVVHDGIPDSVPRADNETGTRMALDNLAKLVEAG